MSGRRSLQVAMGGCVAQDEGGRFVIEDGGQGCQEHGHVVPRYAAFERLVVENSDVWRHSHQEGDVPAALRAHYPVDSLAHRSPSARAPSV